MKNKKIWNSLTKSIFTKVFIALVVYTGILLVLFILAEFLLSSFIWRETYTLYRPLKWISDNRFIFTVVVWLIGFIAIFLRHLYKSLNYIDDMITASNQLINKSEDWIVLPDELADVEKQMNEIKQTALKNANIAAENEQRKNDLIIYLAHDLKTPLTSVIGYLTLLNDEEDISKKTKRKYLGIALEKSNRLENLINELFDVARYNTEKIILEKEDLNLNLMIEQIIDEFYPMLNEHSKKINFIAPKSITFNGDSNKLARVFNNLIKNAINYSSAKSTILIELCNDNQNIIINIKNYGTRIPEAKLNKIFDKFYRIDSSRTTATGGSGLGLAIAKDIVELHNGSISVFSDDKETTFCIALPVTVN